MAKSGELQRAVDKLVQREPGWKSATTPPAVGPRPGTVSTGRPSSSTPVGVFFAEKDAAPREYYDARALTSSDGIFQISWQPIKSILLEGNVRATFKEPPP